MLNLFLFRAYRRYLDFEFCSHRKALPYAVCLLVSIWFICVIWLHLYSGSYALSTCSDTQTHMSSCSDRKIQLWLFWFHHLRLASSSQMLWLQASIYRFIAGNFPDRNPILNVSFIGIVPQEAEVWRWLFTAAFMEVFDRKLVCLCNKAPLPNTLFISRKWTLISFSFPS